jgi:4-hydroxy-tetrahydrodipicolinate synthase
VQALIAVGTTGESPTLTPIEHEEVIALTIEYANRRVPVIAGTGSNSTAESILLTGFAERSGADGALVVSPYYNKPPQEGIYRHFCAVADSTQLPIIPYDILGRTGVRIESETRIRMLQHSKNIVGFKEASGIDHFVECRGAIEEQRSLGNICQNVSYYSGDDDLTGQMILRGAHGVISVLGNIDPKGCREYLDLALIGNATAVEQLDKGRFGELAKSMFLTTNPIPVKWAAHRMGLIEHPNLRLPLVPLEEVENGSKSAQLDAVLEKYHLI